MEVMAILLGVLVVSGAVLIRRRRGGELGPGSIAGLVAAVAFGLFFVWLALMVFGVGPWMRDL